MSRVMIAMVINLMSLSFDDIPEDVVRTLEVGGAVDHVGHSSLLQQGEILGGLPASHVERCSSVGVSVQTVHLVDILPPPPAPPLGDEVGQEAVASLAVVHPLSLLAVNCEASA